MIEAFTEHRRLLFGIAYRMLGRVAEAEDIVQEAWLRWQRQNADDVRSAKAWLVATVTRLCIDRLRSAQQQREEYYGVWLPEPLVTELAATPEDQATRAESLSMAFMLMLESLSPMERAVFLLREVFDYDYAEIAPIVGKSEANCRQIARRAKAALASREGGAEPVPDERAERAVRQFFAAAATGEVRDLVALLTEDATLYTDGGGRVLAAGRPIHSADHISRFFVGIRGRATGAQRVQLTRVNGRPGALVFQGERLDRAAAFDLDASGERISAIYIVRNPEKLRHLATESMQSRP